MTPLSKDARETVEGVNTLEIRDIIKGEDV